MKLLHSSLGVSGGVSGGGVVDSMMSYLDAHPEFYRFFVNALCPDESFFQTLYAKTPFFHERHDSFYLYADWGEGKASPRSLEALDVAEAYASGMILARKWEFERADDSALLALRSLPEETSEQDAGPFKIAEDPGKTCGADQDPVLSIIVACYNCEKTVRECYASIQNDRRIQVVFVDDCSIDGTFTLLRQIEAERTARTESGLNVVVVQTRKNSGAGDARNLGLSYATGEYVMFLDSDDRLVAGACAVILGQLEAHRCDCLTFDALYGRPGALHPLSLFASPSVSAGRVDPRVALVYGKGAVWGKVYRRSLVTQNNITFMNIPTGEDIVFAKQAFACAQHIVYCDKPLYVYIDNPVSLMHDEALLDEETPAAIYEELRRRLLDRDFEEELNSLYYILVVYPTMIALLRKGASARTCAERFERLASGWHRPDRYFARLERKFKLGRHLFRMHQFWLVRWALERGR